MEMKASASRSQGEGAGQVSLELVVDAGRVRLTARAPITSEGGSVSMIVDCAMIESLLALGTAPRRGTADAE